MAKLAASFGKRLMPVRQRPFRFDGAVAFATGFSALTEQQRLVLPTVRSVAAGAVADNKGAVQIRQPQVFTNLRVAFSTEAPLRHNQHPVVLTLVRQVTGQTLPLAGRIMIDTVSLGLFGMTVKAQFVARLTQQC